MRGTTAPLTLAMMLREEFNPLSTQSNKQDKSPTDYQTFYLQCPGLFSSYYDWLKNIMEIDFFLLYRGKINAD